MGYTINQGIHAFSTVGVLSCSTFMIINYIQSTTDYFDQWEIACDSGPSCHPLACARPTALDVAVTVIGHALLMGVNIGAGFLIGKYMLKTK